MSEEFLKIIKEYQEEKPRNIGICAHQNADPDSIASAVGLKYLLNHFFPDIEINLCANSISSISQKLLTIDNEIFQSDVDQSKVDIVFICDANNIKQLGTISFDKIIAEKKPIIIIDHHEEIEKQDEIKYAIIRAETSTAEIIGKIFEELKISPPSHIATYLLTGIIFDTRRFIYRSNTTFDVVQFLIKNGGDYEKALEILQKEPSESEKIAKLKGITRTTIHRDGNDIFAFSHISSYESALARSLISLGASFALVLAVPTPGIYRVSIRCTKEFAESNNISLGVVANNLAIRLNGSGGGHKTAAGINFDSSKEFPKEKEEIIQLLKKMILGEIKDKL